jgi:hypothetical protein
MKIFLHIGLNIIAAFCCILLAGKLVVAPQIAKWSLQTEYQELMFACDNVMRDHLIAKTRVTFEKSEMSLKQLKSAEMGLVTCHDYDVMRKQMKFWGVSDSELSLLGLEVIEKKSVDLERFVDIHEIKY